MTQTATLLLFLAGELTQGERSALDEFSRRKHLSLGAPAPTPRTPYPAYRHELVLDLEGRLDEARTLASSLDEDHALELLGAIERDLSAHPELPQAAWLLAEHHRIAADVRRAAPEGAPAAEQLDRQAHALEGARAAAFGTEPGLAPASDTVRVVVRDLDPRDSLEIDGVTGKNDRSLEPGVHQARVLRGGELAFAGWATLTVSGEVALGVRPLVPCSSEDLGSVLLRGRVVSGTSGVRCPRFVIARREADQLEVADCTGSACSPFTPLKEPRSSSIGGLSPWAFAALTTTGVVAAMLLTTWAAGGFQREQPPDKTVFVYGGLQ
jgi:hypothetical protein